MGTTRHEWESVQINDFPIENIKILQGNSEYMRGFKIFYRNGQHQLIGNEGDDVGTVNFEENDVLIGMTIRFNSQSDKRPRRFGFTLIRNGSIFKSELYGNSFGHMTQKFWPALSTLYGRQDVENLKIRKIAWSQWGSGDEDLSGLRFYPFNGPDSDILGETRYSWAETELPQTPI